MRLRHATTAQDESSEALATSFVRASPTDTASKDVDDFVKEFREMRKVYHKRQIWGDRWTAGEVASTVTCMSVLYVAASQLLTHRLAELFQNIIGCIIVTPV